MKEGTLFGEELPLGVYNRPPWSAKAAKNANVAEIPVQHLLEVIAQE